MRTVRKKKARIDQQRERRQALIGSGLRIVSRHGYANASVSRVTEAAGLAQGTLYSYFDSHQAFLEELLPAEGERFFAFMKRNTKTGSSFFETERSSISAFSRYLKRHRYFLRVLTDAESAAPQSYARHMEQVEARYLKALLRGSDSGELRPQDEPSFRVVGEILAGSFGHLGIGAMGRPFPDADSTGLFSPAVVDTYLHFIRSGFGEKVNVSPESRSPGLLDSPPASTREVLLEAAARVVWRSGFEGATIKAIVQQADLAVGTFYSHFHGQQQIFDELLTYVRAKLVAHVRLFVDGHVRFIDREYAGFVGFFDYLQVNPWYIRIESAAAVYATQTYRRHFFDLSESYVRLMSRAKGRGELAGFQVHELPVLSYILMAARHYLAARYLPLSSDSPQLPEHVYATYRAFIESGLERA